MIIRFPLDCCKITYHNMDIIVIIRYYFIFKLRECYMLNNKYNTSFLVLLYNKEFNESQTLNTILDNDVVFNGCELVIWNNGPQKINDDNVDRFKDKGFSVSVIQTVNNISLSKIYNKFIQNSNSDKYVILDDDSILNGVYLNDVIHATSSTLCIPIIHMNKEIKGPRIDKKIISEPHSFTNKYRIIAIGSGIVIGSRVVKLLIDNFNDVFDETFYLYGVDTSFFLRVNKLDEEFEVNVIHGILHSLSRYEVESKRIKKFRKRERSSTDALLLCNYKKTPNSQLLFFKNIISNVFKIITFRNTKLDLKEYIITYLSEKHYRNRN